MIGKLQHQVLIDVIGRSDISTCKLIAARCRERILLLEKMANEKILLSIGDIINCQLNLENIELKHIPEDNIYKILFEYQDNNYILSSANTIEFQNKNKYSSIYRQKTLCWQINNKWFRRCFNRVNMMDFNFEPPDRSALPLENETVKTFIPLLDNIKNLYLLYHDLVNG